MPVVTIGEHFEVVLPAELCEKMGLKPGDKVNVRLDPAGDFPETGEPLSPETEAAIERAMRDMKEGRVSPPLRSDEEIDAYLKKLESDNR